MILSKSEKPLARSLKRLLLRSPRGMGYFCPICGGWFWLFFTYGIVPRRNAMCPDCFSLERHRLLWLALERHWRAAGTTGGRLLHVAPEKSLAQRLACQFECLSIDLDPARGMVRMDVTSLQFPDGTFDAVVCNHVLEHVEDDRKALAEMYRVLKPGGWASIQVPMKGKATVEAAGVLNAYEQLHLFGQEDHVRQYGRDFEDRLREAGFRVEIIQKHDLAGKDLLRRLAVEAEQEVWLTFKDRTS